MLEAIVWPLAIAIIWAALFVGTLSMARWAAHDHDQALDVDHTTDESPPEGYASSREEAAPPEGTRQPATV